MGIGKTRLVEEFVHRAEAAGLLILRGSCYEGLGLGPYWPFLLAIRQLTDGGSALQRDLDALANDTAERPWADLSEDARSRRARFLLGWSSRFASHASSKTLLWIDDLQWSDVGTLLLLNTIVDLPCQTPSIICTLRAGVALGPDKEELLTRLISKGHRLHLGPLPIGEIEQLIHQIVGYGHLGREDVATLSALTRGNPLFIQQVLNHLLESGLLAEHRLTRAVNRGRLPVSVAEAIDQRISALPSGLRRVLSVASTIGVTFSTDFVAGVLGANRINVEDRLGQALSRRIVERANVNGADYRFVHPLLQIRLYEKLPTATREKIHRSLARLCSEGRAAVGESARHFALGYGTRPCLPAGDSCARAAEQAERLLAYEDAADFWELALKVTPARATAVRAEMLRRFGWTLWATGNWTGAIRAWTSATSLFDELGDEAQAAKLALALGEMHRWRVELRLSEKWLRKGLTSETIDKKERARALALLASIHCLRRDTARGAALLDEAQQLMSEDRPDPLIAYWISYALLTTGQTSKARALARTAIGDAERQERHEAASLLAGSLFHHELANLKVKAAQRLACSVRRAAKQTDTTALTYSIVCDALLLGYRGQWRKVIRTCEQRLDRVRLAGKYQLATTQFILGQALVLSGLANEGIETMRRALPLLGKIRPVAAMHLAQALCWAERQDDAMPLIQRYAKKVLASRRSVAGLTALADAASRLHIADLTQQCYDTLASEARPAVMVYRPLSVQRVLGRLASSLEHWDQAIEHFELATAQLAPTGAVWELACTHLDYAEMRRRRGRKGDGRKANALEVRAEQIFDGLETQVRQPTLVPAEQANPFGLTSREIEVLSVLADGKRNDEIAEAITVSPRTVARHIQNILGKMDAASRTEAVMKGVRAGLVGAFAPIAATRE